VTVDTRSVIWTVVTWHRHSWWLEAFVWWQLTSLL